MNGRDLGVTFLDNKKVVTIVYGCQMSERDAETLTQITRDFGYSPSDDLESADLVIVNTCCVRESAENKILGKIGELKKLKERNPKVKIAISGCMVQQPGALERLQKRAPHVDIWEGTHNINDFSALLQRVEQGEKVAEVWQEPNATIEVASLAEKGKLQASVNVMYGCDNFCSYCIVPYVRGRERSRKPQEILQEIELLVNSGCREVTLLGQNIIGKTFEVLAEGPSKTNPERLTGRTRGNELVVFNGNLDIIGSLVNVRINEAGSWTLIGEIE